MTTDPAVLAKSVRSNGYGLWPGFVTGAVLDRLTAAAEALLAGEHARPYPKSTRVFDLYLHSGPFADLACHPGLAELLDELLGPRHLLSDLSLNSVHQNQPIDAWHIDYPFTEMHTPIAGAVLAVQCVLALSPFTVANGATQLIAGTHHQPRTPPATISQTPVRFTAHRGTLLIMAAATWHRSSTNVTADRRDAVLLNFVERWIKPMSAPAPADADGIPPRLAELLALNPVEETINGVPL